MNVQLIVYPQYHNGQYNYTSYWANEFLMDGTMFNTVMSSTDYSTSAVLPPLAALFDAINNNPPLINQWQRYKTPNGVQAVDGVGQVTLYTAFHIPAQDSSSGIYQRLSGLTVGATYILELPSVYASNAGPGTNIIGPTQGLIVTALVGGTTQIINTANILPSGTQVGGGFSFSFAFTAQTTSDTICFSWFGESEQDLYLQYLSVHEEGVRPATEYTDFSNGQVICDLYEDEDIPLTLSVDEFKNKAEQVHSYSKAFKLPATKRNNKIFNDMFEITRTAQNNISFNPYVKTQCVLKQEGFILFEGYLRMVDITDQNGEISYNVNLYSLTVALADVLKDRTFANMNFLELAHTYNITAITNSWNDSGTAFPYTNPSTSGFRSDYDTIKYPFVDWTRQWKISDGTNGTANYPELVNLEQAFRPFIQIKYLIDRIFSETNQFSYTSTFFNTNNFKKLYMDFNWGENESGSAPLIDGNLRQVWQYVFGGSVYYVNETSYNSASKLKFNVQENVTGGVDAYWDNTNYKFTSTVNNLQVELYYQIYIKSYATSYPYYNFTRLCVFNSAGQVIEVLAENNDSLGAGQQKKLLGTANTVLSVGDYIQAQSYVSQYAADNNKIGMSNNTDYGGDYLKSILDFTVTNEASETHTLLAESRGDVGQWDFLKGIMNMFNLITIPDPNNPNNLLIEPYGDVFINETSSGDINDLSLKSRGIQHDWTEKIDVSDIKLTPLTDLKKITEFKFVEDEDDVAFKIYKDNTVSQTTGLGHLYGSLIYDASAYTILDGIDEVSADPFAATVPKPLTAAYTDFIVPAIYSMDEEGITSSFANSPRIMYNNGVVTLNPTTYYIPAQNSGSAVSAKDSFLQFSHLTEMNPTVTTSPPASTDTIDFHFGPCQLIPPIGNPTANNLFNMYWAPYYNELYNPDTRTMTIKVNLNSSDINMFNFYDTVMIKNRQFRVNKIDYKPYDLSVVEFILIP